MPIGRGEGGGSFSPSSPSVPSGLTGNPTTLANGSTVTLRLDLKTNPAFAFNYVTSIVARIDGSYLASGATDSGPIWCSVFIQKGAQVQLVDKGYIRLAFGRGTVNTVGMKGVWGLDPNMIVFANFVNESGASQDVRLDAETQGSLEPLPESTLQLSTEPEAMFEWQATYTQAATPGSPVIDMTIGAGDHFKLNTMRVVWTTGAAQGISVLIVDDQATPIQIDALALVPSGATVSMNMPGNGQVGTTSGALMNPTGLQLRNGMTLRTTDNAGTPAAGGGDVLVVSITGMVRGRVPTITDNGTGNVATESVKYKRVR